MESLGVGHDWATSLSLFTFMHWRRKWQPIPVLLPGESQGRGCLVGCRLWGHTESDTTEATWQQQQCLKWKSCRTLCDPMDCIVSPGQNTGVGSHSLLQVIFPTQGSNPGIPHCRRILYQLSHQGSPRILEWGAYPFSRGSSWARNRPGVPCIAGGFFTRWATKESTSVQNYLQFPYNTIPAGTSQIFGKF